MKVNYQPSDKAQRPTDDKGIGVKYAAAKRGGFKGRWYLLLTLVIAPVVVVGWILLRPHLFILASGIVTTEPLEVRAPSAGDVAAIMVKRGDVIAKGADILTLVDMQLDAQIQELEKQLSQLEFDHLSINAEILAQLQQRIDVAAEGVTRQDGLLDSFERYQRQGVVPTADMAAVLQAHTAAKMALEQAQVDLMQARQQQKTELLAGAIAQSKYNIELQLARLKAQKSQLHIKALSPTRIVDVLVQVGEHIVEDRPLVLLSGREHAVIFAYLDPKYLEYTSIGQKATIKLPNGTRVRAEVSEPTELVGRLPKQLSGPFDGEKPALKIILKPESALPTSIEGVPVEVSFDYLW
ncbi:HlyD family secretion protein [Shewanella xiamenensis]|uniref:HlyD family secretion protein n=1 Tax=Shewanella xiamenensis TaxID=332186 RepID=UPI002E7B5C65|nr:biotin/lipoyl-binding protein [Shewanella xiamenensis]MEE1981886.1 biotin/lipoyl-binding protein [Shewanella xiamenensis]